MISEPGRYIEEYLDAGCDSITFHVEIEEPIAPTLRAIREAGRAAGLAVKPGTPLSALEPYAELLDIVLVMTVEPGFGGQSFMKDVAQDEAAGRARRCSATRRTAARSMSTAASTARPPSSPAASASMSSSSARRCSSRAATWAARSGSSGPSPTRASSSASTTASPRSRATGWCTFTSLPKPSPSRLMDEIEAGGVPVVMLRGDGQMNPDGVRDFDLLVPATVETLVVERHADAREAYQAQAAAWREAFIARARRHRAAHGVVRALLQRVTAASVRVEGEAVGEIGHGLVILLGVGPDDAEAVADDLARKAAELRIFRDDDGRTNRSLLDVGGAALVVSQFTLFADTRRGRRPGFTGAAPPELAERLYERFAATLRRARAWRSRPAASARRWP